ncbi:MAG: Tricorn protease-like protein, partial [Pseudomonadota bacterium]
MTRISGPFVVSPDAKSLIVWDKKARLQKVDIASGAVTLLSQNETGGDDTFAAPVFSPDGAFIAYAETSSANFGNVSDLYVQNVATGERVKATSSKFNDYAPAFSADGAWLYFISDRNFSPEPGSPWGDRNMGVSFPDRGEVHALQLDPEAEFPFRPANELTGETDGDESDKDGDADEKEADEKNDKPSATITLTGLADRLYKLPLKPGAS